MPISGKLGIFENDIKSEAVFVVFSNMCNELNIFVAKFSLQRFMVMLF